MTRDQVLTEALDQAGVLPRNIQKLFKHWGKENLCSELPPPEEQPMAWLHAISDQVETVINREDKDTTVWDVNLGSPADAKIVFTSRRPGVASPVGRMAPAWKRQSGGYLIRCTPDLARMLIIQDDPDISAYLLTDGKRLDIKALRLQPIYRGDEVTQIIVEGEWQEKT